MINGFSDYEKTETNEFEKTEKVEVGGHLCKVLVVETEVITSKKDGKQYNILKIKFDLEAQDKQAGFYGRKFAADAKKDALNAKWKGYYRLTIPTNESPDFAKTNWKTFITSIEKSNPGVKINGSQGFDENILVGKLFAGVFGLEEMTLPTDGRTISFSRIRFARSIDNFEELPIPKVKLLDGTYVDYEEYINKESDKKVENKQNEFTPMDSDDDLPF